MISSVNLCPGNKSSSDCRVDMAAGHVSNGLGEGGNLEISFWWYFWTSNELDGGRLINYRTILISYRKTKGKRNSHKLSLLT